MPNVYLIYLLVPFIYMKYHVCRLASVAGAVIEATARPDFEDFLRTRSPGRSLLADPASALALRSRWLAFLADVTSR